MSRRNNKRRLMGDINVVPYIDVMLVLLIIFMVTAPLLKQGVDVDLPTAPAKVMDVDSPEPIVISVDAAGRAYLNISKSPDSPIDDEQLISEVQAALVKQKTRPVMVRGDKAVAYQEVISVLVLLQQASIESVGLVTEPGEERR